MTFYLLFLCLGIHWFSRQRRHGNEEHERKNVFVHESKIVIVLGTRSLSVKCNLAPNLIKTKQCDVKFLFVSNQRQVTLSNMASEHSWSIGKRTAELLRSSKIDTSCFAPRNLRLCQSFCLIWQNKQTGDVYGRQKCGALTNTATAAVLLDLYVAGKIYLESEVKRWMDKKREVLVVKVADLTPTGTFLDNAIFRDILEYHQNNPERPKTVVEWIIQGHYRKDNTATVVLESLVEAEILGRESKLFGRRYPLLNPEPKNKLQEEIREIALCGQQPDGYMWCLLKLLCAADECFGKTAPLLSRYFNPDELASAQDCINGLLRVETETAQQPNSTKQNELFELDIVK